MSPLKVQFISLEEDDKDLVVSFAIDDTKGDIESLILLRTLFHEEYLDADERGVRVSLENEGFEEEHRNVLVDIQIENDEVVIRTTFREYRLDISRIEKGDVEDMVRLLRKQNYDNRFTMRIA
jgi:hypothetical protein